MESELAYTLLATGVMGGGVVTFFAQGIIDPKNDYKNRIYYILSNIKQLHKLPLVKHVFEEIHYMSGFCN